MEQHRQFIERLGLDIRGRIYVSSQGINSQYGGTVEHATAYAEWVKQQPDFQVGDSPGSANYAAMVSLSHWDMAKT